MNLTVVGPLAGAAAAAGAVALFVGVRGVDDIPRPPTRLRRLLARAAAAEHRSTAERTRRLLLVGAGVLAGAGLWLFTRMPVVGLVAAATIVGGPWLFGATGVDRRRVDRLEAIEMWTRRLADLAKVGMGLNQAIIASATDAPTPIRVEVTALADTLRSGVASVDAALRGFAELLADPEADEVIAAILINVQVRGPRLADVLLRIAGELGDRIEARRAVSADRADSRVSTYVLTAVILAGFGFLAANHSYTAAYQTPAGQLVMAACVAVLAALLAWMRWLNLPRLRARILGPAEATGATDA